MGMSRSEPAASSRIPANFPVSVNGLPDAERGEAFAKLLGNWLIALGGRFDLQSLDGATAVVDYGAALTALDRGFQASRPLEPTRDKATGIAMAVPVLRNGLVKSHLVLDLNYLIWLEDEMAEGFVDAVHVLAHECAHVEITAAYDRCFPGVLLRQREGEAERFGGSIAMSCWDEFAATWRCAGIGRDPTTYYETTFLEVLGSARSAANEKIKAYRVHADVSQVVSETFAIYGNLLKFASYVAGNMKGRSLTLDDLPATKAALTGHWFRPFFDRLQEECSALSDSFGQWSDRSQFLPLVRLVDDLVAAGGVVMVPQSDGRLYAHIPFSAETMPRAG
jgi:hypothetical protein